MGGFNASWGNKILARLSSARFFWAKIFNAILILLVPRKGGAESIKVFRPISLGWCMYKLTVRTSNQVLLIHIFLDWVRVFIVHSFITIISFVDWLVPTKERAVIFCKLSFLLFTYAHLYASCVLQCVLYQTLLMHIIVLPINKKRKKKKHKLLPKIQVN